MLDNAAPTGGSLTVNAARRERLRDDDEPHASRTSTTPTDIGGSGVASSTLTVASRRARRTARAAASAAETPAVDGAFTATDGTCYRFTLTGTDHVGNAADR